MRGSCVWPRIAGAFRTKVAIETRRRQNPSDGIESIGDSTGQTFTNRKLSIAGFTSCYNFTDKPLLLRVLGLLIEMLEDMRATQNTAQSLGSEDAAAPAPAVATSYPINERRRRLSPAALKVASEKVLAPYSAIVIEGIARLVDLCLVATAGLAVSVIGVAGLTAPGWNVVVASTALAVAAVMAFQVAGLYDVQGMRARVHTLLRTTLAWTVVLVICAVAVIVFAPSDDMTRRWLGVVFPVGLAGLLVARAVASTLVRRWTEQGRLNRRTVVVGADLNGEKLIKLLHAEGDSGLNILGVFDDRNDDRALEACYGVPKLGKVADIVEFARRTRIDLVLFALPISAENRILDMLKQLCVLPVDIRLSAHANSLRFRPRAYTYVGNVPTINVSEQPIRDWDLVTKWLFDRIVGGLILVAISPLLALIALAIKLDSPGPVLFKQKRFGFNNDRVDVFKFRSLYHDQADPLAAKVVTKGDKRVTRVGRFIRRSSLDELPQLFNVVFAGNLSLVGPRPHAVQQKLQDRKLDEAVDGYFARHRVKPGMTGWAQVNGWRGELDTTEKVEKRVEYDLAYIENWSLLFDLYILAKTPISLIKTDSAY